jgi:hypothetical protein
MDEQTEACRQLMIGVVHLAVMDACLPPYTNQKGLTIRAETKSAFAFLFGHGEVWLEYLDMDAQQFRDKLLKTMYGNEYTLPIKDLTDLKKRCFKINHKLWNQLTAYQRVMGAEWTE